ncbi:MAG: hypothetical protein ACI9DF_004909, partial [Verrucomicrobiales bacterium]
AVGDNVNEPGLRPIIWVQEGPEHRLRERRRLEGRVDNVRLRQS